MEFADRLRLNMLFDFYANLLTDKQRELFELHYQYDLSLGEIAENFQVSRQAVHDLLKRTIGQLKSYEESLLLVDKYYQRQRLIDELLIALNNEDMAKARTLAEELNNT